jgi:hypothetical protein
LISASERIKKLGGKFKSSGISEFSLFKFEDNVVKDAVLLESRVELFEKEEFKLFKKA